MREPASLEPAGQRGRLVDVLRNDAFLRLWLVQALSQTGQNMVNFAVLILVAGIVQQHQITQANTAVAVAVLSFSAPAILFAPIAGVVVERARKRTVLVVTNALRGLAALGLLVVGPEWRPLLALTTVYAIMVISGAVGQFFGPALGATVPEVVPGKDIVHANALFNLTMVASQLAGFAAIGPVLIKLVGLEPVLGGIVGLFAACALLSLTIPGNAPAPSASVEHGVVRSMMLDVREGALVILQSPILLRAISSLSLATASYLMVAVLGPEFITGVLGLPRQDFVYIIAPAGVGILAGVLAVGPVAGWLGPERTIDWSMTAAGVLLVLLGLVGAIARIVRPGAPEVGTVAVIAAGVLAALLGVATAFIMAPSQSLLQSASPVHMRARVYAAFFTVSNAVAFIPIIFAGALADLFGVAKVLVGIGVLLGAAGAAQVVRGKG